MKNRSLSIVSVLLACTSCESRPQQSVAITPDDVAPIAFQVVDTILPEQEEARPIIRLSGSDFDEEGNFLIADASEGIVGVFSATGDRVRTLGRSGGGPGEFSQPRHPRFSSSGRIYVGDSGASAVNVFSRFGEFQRRILLPWISPLMGFDLHGDTMLVVTGRAMDQSAEVLFLVDTLGNLRRRYLPIRNVLPANVQAEPIWNTMKQFWLAVSGDSAFVVSTITDSLWTVSLIDGEVSRLRIPIPEYVPATTPRESPRNVQDITSWAQTFHTTASVLARDGELLVTFVKGVLNYGDPNILMLRRMGQWYSQSNVNPPLNVFNGHVIGILDPNADDIQLSVLKRTGSN